MAGIEIVTGELTRAERGRQSECSELLYALKEIKKALYDTGEFDNYECRYGHTLGTCPNDSCLHCRVKRILDSVGV